MLVIPGDEIGTAEEYIPNFGVYTDGDMLFSSNIGDLQIDPKTHTAKVQVKTRIPKMQGEGIITLGVVVDATDKTALIDLIDFKSKNFDFISRELSAVLRVSEVRRGYTSKVNAYFKIGDIVRVRILEVTKDSVLLTTNDHNLGVIKAFCTQCRAPVIKKDAQLVCSSCGATQFRKFAADYGSGEFI